MKKKNTAVLHLRNKDSFSILSLARRVSTGISENKATFPNPDISMDDLSAASDTLDVLNNSKDGSRQKTQMTNDQALIVYGMLKTLTAYVNRISNGDRVIILLSGFDCSNEPISHTIPGKAVIQRVVDGSTSCSAKIYIEKLDEADRYKVETSLTPTDPNSWKTVLDPGSLRHLEIDELPYGVEISIRVTGGNNKGWGAPSEPIPFIAR